MSSSYFRYGWIFCAFVFIVGCSADKFSSDTTSPALQGDPISSTHSPSSAPSLTSGMVSASKAPAELDLTTECSTHSNSEYIPLASASQPIVVVAMMNSGGVVERQLISVSLKNADLTLGQATLTLPDSFSWVDALADASAQQLSLVVVACDNSDGKCGAVGQAFGTMQTFGQGIVVTTNSMAQKNPLPEVRDPVGFAKSSIANGSIPMVSILVSTSLQPSLRTSSQPASDGYVCASVFDPLILDMAGYGIPEILPNRVLFDLLGSGIDEVSWVGPNLAFLVNDPNDPGNQTCIQDGSHFIGSQFQNGFSALRGFDQTHDSKITNADSASWNSLKVWYAADYDLSAGNCGHLQSLDEVGITEIDIPQGPHAAVSQFYVHGQPHVVQDVLLHYIPK